LIGLLHARLRTPTATIAASMFSPLLALGFALIPGVVAWWTGRRILRSIDDPALPELLMASRQRSITVAAFSIVMLIASGGRHALWGLPLQLIVFLIGSYPLRRALRGETTSLPAHLWYSVRSIVGGFGFWMLLGCTPLIVSAFGQRWWPASVVLLVVLLLWEQWYPRLWLWFHDAVPLVDPALVPRLQAIVAQAGMQPRETFRVGAPGTRFVNALALPSVRRPAIAMGNGLLELLEPDEVAAIFAHELAHIEHYSPRVVRQLQLVNRLLILSAVAVPLLLVFTAPVAVRWAQLLWPIAALFVLIPRAAHRQHNETESDLRAAALCGDPEVVVRALIKLHVHALIPRRWPVDFERGASHPSLARRVQALRGTGAQAVASLSAPTVLNTAREGSIVLLDDARAYWFEGVPVGTAPELDILRVHASSYRSVQYPDLMELRVVASDAGRALKATHRNGDAWSVPLDPAHVAAVQKALDVVDVHLHRELGRRSLMTPKLIAGLMLFALVLAGDLGVLLLPLGLVLWRPSTAALAALGTMALARSGLAVTYGDNGWMPGSPELAFILVAVAGCVTLWTAVLRVRNDRLRDGARVTVSVLGALTVIALAAVIWQLTVMTPKVVAAEPTTRTLAVALLGLGAAMAAVMPPRSRWGGWATIVAGVACVSATLIVAPRFDRSGALTGQTARATVVASDSLDPTASGLNLSPDGKRFIVSRVETRRRRANGPTPQLTLVTFDASRRDLSAVGAAFVDSTRLLLLRDVGDSLELVLEPVDADSVLWRAALPALAGPSLFVSPSDGTWTVTGDDERDDSTVVLSGAIGRGAVHVRRLGALEAMENSPPMVFGGGARVVLATYGRRTTSPLIFTLLGAYGLRSELWQIDSTGQRRVATLDGFPECGHPDAGRALCLTRGRNRAEVWTVSERGEVRSLGTLGGGGTGTTGVASIGPGGRLAFATIDGKVKIVDTNAGSVTTVVLPDVAPNAPSYVSALGAAPGYVATMRHEGQRVRVTLYRVR
jgi:Zn-dependent protease with chaperone function